jgi:catechol 2,3-dioxygenase-like lactoylglutathione lyase family enzyme
MFKDITHSRVFVNNQDEARDFYVDKLGLEVSADVDLEVMRWLTVRVPGSTHNVLLEQSDASFRDEASAEQIKELMSKGDACMFILETDDCHATFDEMKAKGVEIIEFTELAKMRERMKPVLDQWASKSPLIAEFIQKAQATA